MINQTLNNNGVLLFDFGTILVGLSKERCVRALEQIGCGRIAYYVDECRQEDLFHELEIGGSIEAFCDEARRQSSYTDEKGVYHPCKATNDEICWAWNQLLLDIPVEKLRLIHHLHHDLAIHTAILSNTNQIHWQYAVKHLFTADGLTVNDYFDEIFLSCDMQMVKPDDCIYQEMVRQLREGYGIPSLQPHDILFIDDSAKNCMAAEANGIRTFHDPNGDKWMTKLFAGNQQQPLPEKGLCGGCIGNFDGIHLGHKKLLNMILDQKQDGLKATVFTFEPSPEEFFVGHPVKQLFTRKEKRKAFEEMGIDILVEFPLTAQTAATPPEDFVKTILVEDLKAD